MLCRKFSFEEMTMATNHFSSDNVLGGGGFGIVYRGVLPDKTAVAVKCLSKSSRQGDPQFQAEIKVLSKCHHRNIVSLLGYCDESGEKMLVYEFMPRGSLFHSLHLPPGTSFLTMEQRLEICIGVARGLDHLHSGTSFKIIHRDVKTANILLDDNLVAKISDLGLSRASLADEDVSEEITDNVRGTRGYMDPEYRRTCKPSRKFDVYSFGVVLLEVLCGKRAWDGCRSLVDWALPYIKDGNFLRIIDQKLIKNVSPDCSQACAVVITKCLEDDLRKRPPMSKVVTELMTALAMQQGTYYRTSSMVIDSDILRHFNTPRLDTIKETDQDDSSSSSRATTTSSTTSVQSTGIYLSGTEDRIVLYYTSMRAFLKIHQDCQDVREILGNYRVRVDERDISLDPSYKQQIQQVFQGMAFKLPQLFVRGNNIGGADEVRQLHEDGKLEKLLKGFPRIKDDHSDCRVCGNQRFVGCPKEGCINGSCHYCNSYGLIRCPSCCF